MKEVALASPTKTPTVRLTMTSSFTGSLRIVVKDKPILTGLQYAIQEKLEGFPVPAYVFSYKNIRLGVRTFLGRNVFARETSKRVYECVGKTLKRVGVPHARCPGFLSV